MTDRGKPPGPLTGIRVSSNGNLVGANHVSVPGGSPFVFQGVNNALGPLVDSASITTNCSPHANVVH